MDEPYLWLDNNKVMFITKHIGGPTIVKIFSQNAIVKGIFGRTILSEKLK